MLAPDVIAVSDALAAAYSTVLKTDGFAYAVSNTTIGVLQPDPGWLGPIRADLQLLARQGEAWEASRSTFWTPFLQVFNDYRTSIESVAEAAPQLGDNTAAWIALLQQLESTIDDAIAMVRTAQADFIAQIQQFTSIEKVVTSHVDDAWNALAAEEQEMVQLASQLAGLQDAVESLSSNLNASEISAGKSYVQSSISIAYDILTSVDASIPWLSVAGLVFTEAKLAYDMIVTYPKIESDLQELNTLQLQAEQTAQAAAATKVVIRLLTNLNTSLAAISSALPDLALIWSEEKSKLESVVSALNAGAKPSALVDLLSIDAARATWTQLDDFVANILNGTTAGGDFTIRTSQPKGAPTP